MKNIPRLLSCSTAALLVVPGQFIATSADPPPSDSFLQQLRSFVDASVPTPILHNRPSTATAKDSIPTALLHARHVFVRRDAAKPQLAPAYDGPYLVLERSPHTFRPQLGDKTDVVATARLKAKLNLFVIKVELKLKLKAHFINKLNENYRCNRLLCPHCHLAD
jgi:hypothetical protein